MLLGISRHTLENDVWTDPAQSRCLTLGPIVIPQIFQVSHPFLNWTTTTAVQRVPLWVNILAFFAPEDIDEVEAERHIEDFGSKRRNMWYLRK